MRVMSKVKALALLDNTSHPLAEIGIADSALSFLILVFDQFGQIVEVQIFVIAAQHAQNVLNSDISIVVSIQIQKGLANADPIARKLIFDLCFKLGQLADNLFLFTCLFFQPDAELLFLIVF